MSPAPTPPAAEPPSGADFVNQRFDTARPDDLLDRHAAGSGLHELAALLVDATEAFDTVHEEFAATARRAADSLLRTVSSPGSANPDGILQYTALRIDALAIQRAAAHQQMRKLAGVYRRALETELGVDPARTTARTTTADHRRTSSAAMPRSGTTAPVPPPPPSRAPRTR